ncbi:hypothetical protein CLOP_g20848 [Closterium sp. NIES-67]|nr:hypothetical protein CLOP_g20848 [Closterium sp. NIES-67]
MWEAVLPLRLLRSMELQGAAEEEGVGKAEAVGGALAEVEAEKSKAEVTFGPTSCRAKLGKKVLWSLEEETSCIKDLRMAWLRGSTGPCRRGHALSLGVQGCLIRFGCLH